jgi:hypothetical protein
MKWDAWVFSARLGWQNRWMRWSSILTVFIMIAGTALFLWRMVPLRAQAETVVLHYNLYLGIDDVRSWTWIFFLPAIWLVCTIADLAFAFGLYRTDVHFSLSLTSLAFLWSVPWAAALYYLTLVNT